MRKSIFLSEKKSEKLLSLAIAFFMVFSCLIFTPIAIKAEFKYETNILPTDDAVVYYPTKDRNADTNYHVTDPNNNSIDDKMTVQYGKSYAYFKFDISELPNSDKLGKVIFSVFGRDTSKVSGTTPATNYAQVFAAADSNWKEKEITWNNKPSLEITPITEILYDYTNAYQDFDITNYVKTQKDNGSDHITLAILAKAGGTIFMRGRETAASGQKPPRIIVYSPNSTPTTPPTPSENIPLGEDGRSSLYPEDWYPGFSDNNGRFIHDFSYAGYHRGEKEIPATNLDYSIVVTSEPYNADNTGASDSTTAIQNAIDAVANNGGGTVYLPEGTYMISVQDGKNYALTLKSSNVVLKGAGMNKTFIYNSTQYMNQKSIILVGNTSWEKTDISTELSNNITEPTVLIPVKDASKFAVGDNVLISFEETPGFLKELGMQNKWASRLGTIEPLFFREIVEVDAINNILTIDIPTRYALKIRDNVKITKTKEPITEIGIEDFSIANKQNITDGLLEDDYKIPGTAGNACDNAKVINLVGIANSWVRNVNTYKPAENEKYHILSKGIILDKTKNVTIDNCTMEYPQYRGANGNGYLYQFIGNDNLISNCKASAARHSYTYANFSANGNVLYNSYSENSSLVTDFHMYLSMANLIDKFTVKDDKISALTRDYGSNATNRHGVVTTESVFWNTTGLAGDNGKNKHAEVVESEQFGNGYVIGTQGAVTSVRVNIKSSIDDTNTEPFDMLEGVGEGAKLTPQSLYIDQLDKRTSNKNLSLKSLIVNGTAISGMQPTKTKYTCILPFGTTEIPTIMATAVSTEDITITQPTSINDTGTITVSKDGVTKQYTIQFKVSDIPTEISSFTLAADKSFGGWRSAGNKISISNSGKLKAYLTLANDEIVTVGNEKYPIKYTLSNPELGSIEDNYFVAKITGVETITATIIYNGVEVKTSESFEVIPPMTGPEGSFAKVVEVTASTNDGNLPINTIDKDPDTRWSASGDPQWLLLKLETEQIIDKICILYYNGDQRSSRFDLEVSTDGVNYTQVLTNMTSTKQNPNTFETFSFTPVSAKYIRYIGHANELNLWNSIIEFWIYK